jgi:hypothetical protein
MWAWAAKGTQRRSFRSARTTWGSRSRAGQGRICATGAVAAALGLAFLVPGHPARASEHPPVIGERPAVEQHLDQAKIDAGMVSLTRLREQGQLLFDARFNALDGQGRPGSTGTGADRDPDEPAFIRTSSPEANACSGCHAQPVSGGAGDFVANVFVLAQALDPVTFSVSPEFSNERNTLGMHGGGPIEMLAREMSAELIAIRETAAADAASMGPAAEVSRELVAKGIGFGRITVRGDGKVDPSEIEGVDWDLIVKPFHQKGAVVSLREFSNNAMNHHHGMQSVERFGSGEDPDLDGYVDELSVGDMTAIAVFQAALATPGRRLQSHPDVVVAVEQGEELFEAIGCASCHVPTLVLESPYFSEPNPFNPKGNLTPEDVPTPFVFDMTKEGEKPRLEKHAGGGAIVRAFTDLKRYDLNDEDYHHFANEQVPQGTLYGFASPDEFYNVPAAVERPTREFLTRKLWDVGNTDPYGHRGDLTTITEAIHFHGGDARASRDAFFGMPQGDQDAVVEFLKCLQVLPPNSPREMHDGQGTD